MQSHRIRLSLAIWLALSSSACLSPASDLAARHDPAMLGIHVAALDFADQPAALTALPRRATLMLTTPRALDPQGDPVMLFEGDLDSALLDDLKRSPLAAAQRARSVPSAVVYGPGTQIRITPRDDLATGAAYTLAIAGFARYHDGTRFSANGDPFSMGLLVSTDADAGARVLSAFPSAGSAGIATNLSFGALVLDGAVRGEQRGVRLETADGVAVPAQISQFPCTELDASGNACIQLVPNEPLAPLTSYTLKTSGELHDAHGAPVAAFSASFVTAASADHAAPRWHLPSCALDETSTPVGCALIDDHSITLRMQVDEPARFVVRADGDEHAELAPRGASRWSRADLAAGQTLALDIAAIDSAANTVRAALTLSTVTALATLSITEVRADPLGREPAQEYVEILNYGDAPIALTGFMLSDSETELGSAVTDDSVAYPGARVLFVPDDFDPGAELDVSPPLGTPLVRMGKSLGKSGLANTGEPVFLRDSDGRRVSAAPATPKPKAGVCLVRVSDDPRSGTAESFGYDADATCTPGL